MFLTDQETIDYMYLSLGIQPNAPDMINTASDGYVSQPTSTGLSPGATHVKPPHTKESTPKSNKPTQKTKSQPEDPYP